MATGAADRTTTLTRRKRTHIGFSDFDKPGVFDDFVYVENHRDCKKLTLPILAEAYSQRFPGAVVISDMLKDRLDDDNRVITHTSTRGMNGLTHRDMIACYTAPSIELFGELAALDARLGTRNSNCAMVR